MHSHDAICCVQARRDSQQVLLGGRDDEQLPMPRLSAREQLASCRDAESLDSIQSELTTLADEVGKVCHAL
jgi:hypothetical protein